MRSDIAGSNSSTDPGWETSNAARLLASALACCLAGCAGHLEHVLVPTEVPVTAKVDKVDMLVATTRAPSVVVGEGFSGERGPASRFDDVVVSIPRHRVAGEVQWPASLPADPARDFALVGATQIGVQAVGTWFARHGPGTHKLLVFVHGYNTSYEEAVYRFAQIAHDAGTDAAPVLFTWPSRGKTLQYGYDKDSATLSRDGLENLLDRAVADPGVVDVTVIAHSMGSWVAMEALRQMAIRRGRVDPKVRNVVLASADLDVDVFKSQYLDLGPAHPRLTLIVSRDDRALGLSQALSGDVDRLGLLDPKVEPYRSKLAGSDVSVVDLTGVKGEDDLNHTKFAESPQIVRLIGRRLVDGQGGIGTQVFASVGGGLTGVLSTVRDTVGPVLRP